MSALNDLLRADPQLAAYPYRFEVLSLENGVAEISSPRSAQVPVVQFLRLVHPELAISTAPPQGISSSALCRGLTMARMNSSATDTQANTRSPGSGVAGASSSARTRRSIWLPANASTPG